MLLNISILILVVLLVGIHIGWSANTEWTKYKRGSNPTTGEEYAEKKNQ